ncbi:MAG: phosphatidylglycerophosphatase A [Candidatus Omnitrophica bacterium]|nr:phosphatidylglycerophosphatase A [Candidatus Omnitrophota bacterium]MBL7151252.1 phosphatidylglycerophosphatase A [Candidatus Omnitrophota bacterium]
MELPKISVKIISSFFGAGYLPFIPGTFGSLAGLFIFYFIGDSPFVYTLSVFILMAAGFMSCAAAERVFKKKDAGCIVIDEVCGMLLSLAFLPYYNLRVLFAGFIVFRILDSLKPYPAGRLQGLEGSLGVMVDDIVAALYTNIILQAALRLASF